jgi:hypothetical protein
LSKTGFELGGLLVVVLLTLCELLLVCGFLALGMLETVFFRGRRLLSIGVGKCSTVSEFIEAVTVNGSSQVLWGLFGVGDADLVRVGAICLDDKVVLVAVC